MKIVIKYSKCGHTNTIDMGIDEYLNSDLCKHFDRADDFCPGCMIIFEKYGMKNVTDHSDSDTGIATYLFNHTDIRKLVYFAHTMNLHIHNESFHINSPYDCTGQLFAIAAKVTKGKKYLTLTNEFHYDY